MDVILFGGQSNMRGTANSFPQDKIELNGVYEYFYNSKTYQPLKHPCGEHIGEDLLHRASDGNGCILPDFCRAYQVIRPVKIMTAHVAKGGSMLCEWEKGSERYEAAKEKMLEAIKAAKEIEEVEHIYYLWLQGESDAVYETSEEEYFHRLVDYKNALKEDLGIEKFGIIRVGYFSKEDEKFDHAIQNAQERCVKEDKDFLMLTRVCEFLSKDQFFINPAHRGHYNNNALAIIGNCAGEYLSRYAVGEIK
ncbi:MAG: hypothetical protein IJH31_05205 [Erysipelotrichaceae bacterium]|nr:hypothetical protein [Erysipelotrichaceae bacterium]